MRHFSNEEELFGGLHYISIHKEVFRLDICGPHLEKGSIEKADQIQIRPFEQRPKPFSLGNHHDVHREQFACLYPLNPPCNNVAKAYDMLLKFVL